MTTFAEVVEAAGELSLEEQEDLLETLRRRLSAARREEILRAIEEGRAEFAAGKLKPESPAEIMKRICS